MQKREQRALVLVVEDVDWLRAGMVRRLKAHGYDVAEAADAAGAVSVAESLRPALVLTEEDVPTYDELAARLREHPFLSSLPVVIVNPDAAEGERRGDSFLLSGYESIWPFLVELKTKIA